MTPAPKLTKVTEDLVELLTPLASEDRRRVVQAAFVLLGEAAPPLEPSNLGSGDSEHHGDSTLPAKALSWIKQNGLSREGLEDIFHFGEGTVEYIRSELPGKSDREKAVNAYLLTGLTSLLTTGEPKFSDQAARAMCTTFGCYDATNHNKAMKATGSSLAGTKEKGWTLTAPGLKAAAKIVGDLTQ